VIAGDTFRLARISFPNAVGQRGKSRGFFIELEKVPTFLGQFQSGPTSFHLSKKEIIFENNLKINCLENHPLSNYERLIPKRKKHYLYVTREGIENFQDPINQDQLLFSLPGTSEKK
jgi:hypothetical protein